MNIEDLLKDDESAIVGEACDAIAALEHYHRDGAAATRRRMETLYRQVAAAVRLRDVRELRAYADHVARERFEAGFDLSEVQAAFGALEEAIWHDALTKLPAYDQAWGLGLACTALAHGRAALGRAFDAVAPRTPAAAVDLTPLFKGTEAVLAASSADELVFPV